MSVVNAFRTGVPMASKSFTLKLWIHSLSVSTCLTSRQHRLKSIRIFHCIMLPVLPKVWSFIARQHT